MDIYDQVMATDSESEGSVESASTNVILSGTTKVKAVNGKFTFDELIITAAPGSSRQIKISSPVIFDNDHGDH